MPKVSGFCRECGRTIEYWPSQDRQYCSATCKARRQAINHPERLPRKPRRGITTPCEVCDNPVYVMRSERAKGAGRFCSRACHNMAQRKTPVIKACKVCSKELRLKPSQAAIQYCSRMCMGLGRIKRPLDRRHNGRPAKADQHGYIMVWQPDHPNRTMKGWQYEHRLVVEKVVGRFLRTDEHVDHINGVKGDNRPVNLQVLTASAHSKKTGADRKAALHRINEDLAAYRERYGPLT